MQILISNLTINPTYEQLVPRVTNDEYQTMKTSIQLHGIREPIVVNMQNVVIDGHTRIQIAKELQLKEIPYRTESYKDSMEEEEAVIAYNLERRQLNLMQLGILGNKIEVIEKERAKLRNITRTKEILEEKIKSEITPKTEVVEAFMNSEKPQITVKTQPEPIKKTPIDSVQIAAKKVGISKDTQFKVDKIIESAKTNPSVKKEMDEAIRGTKSVNKVFNTVKQLEKREEKRTELKARPLPEDKFEVIYADPPWTYDHEETENRKLSNQYPTMTLEDICTLPIQATDDAILFLWVPMPLIEKGLKVMKSWGFEYKTGMVWVKDKIGMGYYARLRHELLFIGIRGKWMTPDPKDRPDSVIEAPRTEHSVKPSLHDLIEKMYPYRKYIELFARQGDRKNWTYWGNEI